MRRDVSKTQGRVRDRDGVFRGCFFMVRFRIRVRVKDNANPKTAFFLKEDHQNDRPWPRPRPRLLLTPDAS